MGIVESTGLKTAGIHVRKNFNPDDSPVIGLDKYVTVAKEFFAFDNLR